SLPLPDNNAPMLTWARYYMQRGMPIFPCRGKQPLTTHGFHDASLDPFQIEIWWRDTWPDANIGHPIGTEQLVLDVDPRADGDKTLFELQRVHGLLPETWLAHTGGGEHHYYNAPVRIRNKAHIGTGIDVQGPGSYVILPPSIHPDTQRQYVWNLVYGIDDV